ncbi:hypothetical protein LTR37_001395 [Vermiconidia calcicola]|uniref:Uncharacterized protein n=1 Tax=Vermiconidia calcicola TaxID=1690605 RepID=A0ACC3NWI0_9PEZI|nr:hypothetical protein LTR37_001395 [Vermiconidia calcicola]
MRAANGIFDTTELLEEILSFLPPSMLVHARAVCKRLASIIDDSPRFQQKLFFVGHGQNRKGWQIDLKDDTLYEAQYDSSMRRKHRREIVVLNHFNFEVADPVEKTAALVPANLRGDYRISACIKPRMPPQLLDVGDEYSKLYLTRPTVTKVFCLLAIQFRNIRSKYFYYIQELNQGFIGVEVETNRSVTIGHLEDKIEWTNYEVYRLLPAGVEAEKTLVDIAGSYFLLRGAMCVTATDWKVLKSDTVHALRADARQGKGQISLLSRK